MHLALAPSPDPSKNNPREYQEGRDGAIRTTRFESSTLDVMVIVEESE